MTHIETRRKIRAICEVKQMEQLLQQCILTDEEIEIFRLHYMHGKTLGFIADTLGYTEGTVKAKHKKILKKLSAVLPM